MWAGGVGAKGRSLRRPHQQPDRQAPAGAGRGGGEGERATRRTRRQRRTGPRPTHLGNRAAKQPQPQPTNSPPNARGKVPAAEAPRSARRLGAHRPSAHQQGASPATGASRGGAALRPDGLGAHRPSKQRSGQPEKGSLTPPALATKREPSAEGASHPPRPLQQPAAPGSWGGRGTAPRAPAPSVQPANGVLAERDH